ncbi:SUF system NifU family Fe-S cluster assembly protein [Candidatus Woesearchaeota archaeon]|nr:SUF system NifU family Fe-S cluster assembly protein [Candidatus Woesearchaeota archaeon]
MIDMYQEELLEHYKSPRNSGKIENPSVEFHDTNPLCGDEVTVTAKIKNNIVKNLKFESRGCAISVASASKLSEQIKGKTVNEVLKLDNQFVLDLVGVPISAMRLKCALLSLKAIQKAIIQYKEK